MGYTRGDWGIQGNSIVARQRGYILELAKVTPFFQGESEANAHLIAAAPRMAQLLECLANEGWNAGVTEEAREILATIQSGGLR